MIDPSALEAATTALRAQGLDPVEHPTVTPVSKNHGLVYADLGVFMKLTDQHHETLAWESEVLARIEPAIGRRLASVTQPYQRVGDWSVLLMDRIAPIPGDPSSSQLFEGLESLHSALKSLPQAKWPTWRDHFSKTLEMLPELADGGRQYLETFDATVAPVLAGTYEEQLLHGDAHGGNAILTISGVVWVDFEGVLLGPPVFDFAVLDGVTALEDNDEYWRFKLARSWAVAAWTRWLADRDPRWETKAQRGATQFSELRKRFS